MEEKGIPHEPNATKPELYQLIKQHKPDHIEYALDKKLEEHGHVVLRLPPYHPELNPIEKIWAQVKGKVASRNTTFKLRDVEKLTREEFSKVTVENWAAVCRHVDKIVEEYLRAEHVVDDAMERFVINVGNDDSEDDFFEEEDETYVEN